MVEVQEKNPSNEQAPSSLQSAYQDWMPRREKVVRIASDLYKHEDEHELDPGNILLGLELVRLESELSDRQCECFFLIILASTISRRSGSVRMALGESPEVGQSLEDILRNNLTGILNVIDQDYFRFTEIAETEREFWKELADQSRELFQDVDIFSTVGTSQDAAPFIIEDDQIYHHRSFTEEIRLADLVSRRIVSDNFWQSMTRFADSAGELEEALESVLEQTKFELTPEQQHAVLTSVSTPLSIITGGPGTGKTSIALAVIRLLLKLNVDADSIALAAPTGKAANRLAHSISEGLHPQSDMDSLIAEETNEPATIHRLLRYSPARKDFYFDENRPLPHRFVIIDETSMVDLSLMDRLLAAVPDDASLCFLGDADQLPAVESGSVFRDLVAETENTDVPWRTLAVDSLPSEGENTDDPLAKQCIRLTRNFRVEEGKDRTAENLVNVADDINNGGNNLEFADGSSERMKNRSFQIRLRYSFDELQFQGVEMLSRDDPDPGNQVQDSNTFTPFLRNWYQRAIPGDEYGSEFEDEFRETLTFEFHKGIPDSCGSQIDDVFERYNEYQLLTGTRRTAVGSYHINDYLHQLHANSQNLSSNSGSGGFVVGEPVIMTKNDYDRQIFNGEQGIVLNVHENSTGDTRSMAVFPRRENYKAFNLGPLSAQLNHAFALTVHKSQGSEYGNVGFVLPRKDLPLMTRELLYTGVTRARNSVVFHGKQSMITAAAKKQDVRNSGLLERIEP